jgi:alpha-L-rhamnosidase
MDRIKNILFCASMCLLIYSCSHSSLSDVPGNLRCEYLVNPLGIDNRNPRFTWELCNERQEALQTACQLFVGTDSTGVSKGHGNVWESRKIRSGKIPVVYQGPELLPFTRYFWRVRIQNENGNWSGLSEIAFFETGMIDQKNWKGSWISDTYDFNVKPSPYFRKSFPVGKKIKSARAYMAVAGLYELFLNGNRVGDHRLDPMYTRFDRRTLYVTHDITSDLLEGENTVGVVLGNGWYNHQSTAVWYFDKAPWRARPKFCLDLRINYTDGSEGTVSSGKEWKTSTGPVIFNSIYTAEHYDARKEMPGWNKPGFDDSVWKNVLLTGAPSENIVSQAMHPIRNVEEILPVMMIQQGPHTWLFDFGRNIAGVTRIKIRGMEGTEVRLKHGERLDKNGRVDQSNINVHYRPTDDSDPFQTDILILSGKEEDIFMPSFNYKGFQYVEVSADKPVTLTRKSLTAFFMHSDIPSAGRITSSNPTLNKIWQAANVSYLSNLFGYPTDCPQREKNGWTGDAQINIETGLYNFDGITVYEKWLADHQDEQQPNGVLPAIIPTSGWGYHWANGPDWTSTIAIIPWNVYLFYGDSRLLERCYDNIRRYVDHITEISPTGLTDWGLGDWVPVKSKTPKEFTSSIYYYVDAEILSKAAKILDKNDDYKKYQALTLKIKNAINEKFLNRNTCIYGSGCQTELSAALKWGIVPDELRAKVAKNLANRVLSDNCHIDVGLLGTKTILNALSENGYADLAYQVATQETFPSWGWWIVNGATTLYENWPLDAANDVSMNHIMFGEISAWFYKGLGGIFPDESKPGFKNIILKPNFIDGLQKFEGEHKSLYGKIISSWEKLNNSIHYNVSVPANSTATLFLNAEIVTLNGKELPENKEVHTGNRDDRTICLFLKSGSYKFILVQKK